MKSHFSFIPLLPSLAIAITALTFHPNICRADDSLINQDNSVDLISEVSKNLNNYEYSMLPSNDNVCLSDERGHIYHVYEDLIGNKNLTASSFIPFFQEGLFTECNNAEVIFTAHEYGQVRSLLAKYYPSLTNLTDSLEGEAFAAKAIISIVQENKGDFSKLITPPEKEQRNTLLLNDWDHHVEAYNALLDEFILEAKSIDSTSKNEKTSDIHASIYSPYHPKQGKQQHFDINYVTPDKDKITGPTAPCAPFPSLPNTPGVVYSFTPGVEKGKTPGVVDGFTPGEDGYREPSSNNPVVPGQVDGFTPGVEKGKTPGVVDGFTPGEDGYREPSSNNPVVPGQVDGFTPGVEKGKTPGVDPAQTPGVDPAQTPGINPGNVDGFTPGVDPGNTPGVDPGNTPGVIEGDPGFNPGINS